jgi:uncharacterized protein YcfJ
MNKSMLAGALVGALVVTAGGAYAGLKVLKQEPEYADVLAVTPVTETVRTPREVCADRTVTRKKPVKDEHQLTGTLAGAVVGGVLGHQVGGGSGRTIATVAGAAAGGYAGNRIQKNVQDNASYTTTEQHCETVYDTSARQVGVDVRYRLDGAEGVVRMSHDPGTRIPVENGQLAIAAADSDS